MKTSGKSWFTREKTIDAAILTWWVSCVLLTLGACFSVTARADDAEPNSTPKRVRILSLNIWGRDKQECALRYNTIANEIKKAQPVFDIVSLNELWSTPGDIETCPQKNLVQELMKDPSWRDFGKIVRSIKNLPATLELQLDGGNAIFTRHQIVDATDGEYGAQPSPVRAAGFAMAQVKIDDDLTIDVWNTHLDAAADYCDDDCRWEQLTDLSLRMLGNGSGNPVILLGDFNTGGPIDEASKKKYMKNPKKYPNPGHAGYNHIMDDLRQPRDLWLEAHPEQTASTPKGWTMDCVDNPNNGDCKERERIDYAFLPEHKKFLGKKRYDVKVISIKRVEWKTPTGVNVSDHFGLDITLEITKRKGR